MPSKREKYVSAIKLRPLCVRRRIFMSGDRPLKSDNFGHNRPYLQWSKIIYDIVWLLSLPQKQHPNNPRRHEFSFKRYKAIYLTQTLLGYIFNSDMIWKINSGFNDNIYSRWIFFSTEKPKSKPPLIVKRFNLFWELYVYVRISFVDNYNCNLL